MSSIISLINLWCTKNLVDSQFLLGRLLSTSFHKEEKGDIDIQQTFSPPCYKEGLWEVIYSTDPYAPEVQLVFLNTCGFISSGREEMFQTLEKLLYHKKKVCLIGCAVQYFSSPLLKGGSKETKRQSILSNPNLSLLSRNDLKTVALPQIFQGFKSQIFPNFERFDSPRALTNFDQGFEYLKIAEGCNNSCSFCIIPHIRGKQISLPLPHLLHEIHHLVQQGIHEIILIAQDSTRYGTDLYGKPQLFELLEQIEKIPWDFHYRVLYLYPDLLTLHQLKKLTTFKKFIPYFDIPLQHSSSSVLQRMGRFYDEQAIFQFLDFIKANFPVHFIRTNFIIGFPGETEEDFQKLHSFISQDYFDNIALFEYHDEPLAASFHLSDKVSDKVIRSRFRSLRSLVNQLLLARSQKRQKKQTRGYIQEIGETTLTIRPWLHCPEIDEVDDVPLENIISSDNEVLQMGSRVVYEI